MNSQRADPFATLQRLSADDAGMTEALTLLRKIERHLTVIAAGMHMEGPSRPVAAADAKTLGVFLPVLGAGLGSTGRIFTACDALRHLQAHLDGVTIGPKTLGRLFARCAGAPVAGFRIQRDGVLRGVVIWRIWRV